MTATRRRRSNPPPPGWTANLPGQPFPCSRSEWERRAPDDPVIRSELERLRRGEAELARRRARGGKP